MPARHARLLLCSAVLALGVLTGCSDDGGGGDGGGPLAAVAAEPVGATAVDASALLVDDEGRSYVLLDADGEETDTGGEDARPHEGTEDDTAPNLGQVARLTPEGELDPAWGEDGVLSVPFAYDVYVSFRAQRMAFDGEGGLIVAGSVGTDPGSDPPLDATGDPLVPVVGAVRVLTEGSGSVDSSYGDDGASATSLGRFTQLDTTDLDVVGLVADASGATLAIARRGLGGYASTILRLDDTGLPDTETWASGAVEEFSPELPYSFYPTGLAQDGAGTTYFSYPDATFRLPDVGTPVDLDAMKTAAVDIPYVVLDREQAIRSRNGIVGFAVLEDGSVVSANVLYNDEEVRTSAFVTKVGPDDRPDPAFGTGGFDDLAFPPDGPTEELPPDEGVTWLDQEDLAAATGLTVAADGTIYVAGWSSEDEVVVARLGADGALDTEWAEDGYARAEFTIADEFMYRQPRALGIRVLEDGSLLVPVAQDFGPYFGRTVYRFTPGGDLDDRWGDDGAVTVEPTLPAE